MHTYWVVDNDGYVQKYEDENYVIRTIINAPTAIKMEISFASIPKTKYNDVTIQEED